MGDGAAEARRAVVPRTGAMAPIEEGRQHCRSGNSGTHAKEQALWKASGIPLHEGVSTLEKNGKSVEIKAVSPADGAGWYLSVGQGMGATLTIADEKQGYTLADRGTYIQYKFGREVPIALEILAEGDEMLANPYGFIPVNPAKFPHTKITLAEEMANWLVSDRGQKVIADYNLHGKQLFFPDAKK